MDTITQSLVQVLSGIVVMLACYGYGYTQGRLSVKGVKKPTIQDAIDAAKRDTLLD